MPPPRRQPPTVRLRRLATELLRLRRAAGLSQEDVYAQTDINVATLYRIEKAQAKPQLRTLNTLLNVYGVSGAQRQELVALQKDAGKRGWLHTFDTELPAQLTTYISFEQEAVEILNYESLFIPGLLQTEAYARAVITGVLPNATEEEVESRVAARMQRQALLTEAKPLRLWTVMDEASLHRMVGGEAVMREQWQHLLHQAKNPRITIQVLRYSAGAHPGMPGSFIVLKFGTIHPEMVHIDSMGGDLFLENEVDLSRYTLFFEHLRAMALSPSDTAAFLASLGDEDRT